MFTSNPFVASNFDPSLVAPNATVIFDDTGYIDLGGLADPAALGYDQPTYDAFVEQAFDAFGYGALLYDIDSQFPDATYTISVEPVGAGNADHGIAGTSGRDVIVDTAGTNVIAAGGGADLIFAIGAQNFVDAGGGADVVMTGGGDDAVYLRAGADWADLGSGDDAVRAGAGADTVLGMSGDDHLNGQGGGDLLDGGIGNDTLIGGAGNDTLTGGTGMDQFVWSAGDGDDVITDLEHDLEGDAVLVNAAGLGFGSYFDIQAATAPVFGGVVITAPSGDTLTLEGVDYFELVPWMFPFA